MNVNQIVNSLDIELDEDSLKVMQTKAKDLIKIIEKQIKKQKARAEVFIGGSFAKGTLVKRDKYDIDVFVRFLEQYEDLDLKLKKILEASAKEMKKKLKSIHGSRDYFAIEDGNVMFEIIPVRRISKPEFASNSTDLSYFHVSYVKKKLKKNPKLIKDIIAIKAFCRAQKVYGAESWVHGFSGYALECLIIHFNGLLNTLKALSKANGQIILDPEKKYKNRNNILIELNESKRKGPIILVDPTYKSRNVCSALSQETFEAFKNVAQQFLKKPSLNFFRTSEVNENKIKDRAKKAKTEYFKMFISTKKQEGDIAGAKLEKFYRFILDEILKRYAVKESVFDFDEKNSAIIHLIVKPNKNVVGIGPPVKMVHEVITFRGIHKDAFVKAGRWYSPIKSEPVLTFMNNWINVNKEKVTGMDIDEIEVGN